MFVGYSSGVYRNIALKEELIPNFPIKLKIIEAVVQIIEHNNTITTTTYADRNPGPRLSKPDQHAEFYSVI
jgi:hypothetical protein